MTDIATLLSAITEGIEYVVTVIPKNINNAFQGFLYGATYGTASQVVQTLPLYLLVFLGISIMFGLVWFVIGLFKKR